MIISTSLPEKISWIVAQPKQLLGLENTVDWIRGSPLRNGEERIAYPLEIFGQSLPDLSLEIVAYPHFKPQTWSINLKFGIPIARLDYGEEITHTNAMRSAEQSETIPYFVFGSHIHL